MSQLRGFRRTARIILETGRSDLFDACLFRVIRDVRISEGGVTANVTVGV